MDALALIEVQLALEGIAVVDGETLVQLAGAEADEIPRLLLVRHAQGYARYYRADLPRTIRSLLDACSAEQLWHDHAAARRLLAMDGACAEPWIGTSYVFLSPLAAADSLAVRLGSAHQPLIERWNPQLEVRGRVVFAVIVDEQIVATCESSREDARSGEAWVQTSPAFRGRGYARQVTAAWARVLQQQGKLPFYSHRADNLASQAVARGLGLRPFRSDVAFS